MALEFNCPYCHAIIRVPDNSAGKRGKCPKCASRISIPKSDAVRRAAAEQPVFPDPPAPQFRPLEENEDDVVFQEYDPAGDVGFDLDVEAALPPGDVALPSFPGEAPSNLPRPVMQIPDALKPKAKRPRRTGWVWGIAACLVLGGGGAAGYFYWLQLSTTLTGELPGQLVENPLLPAKFVPRTDVEMPAAEVNKILTQLQRNPSTLVSSLGLATVQFQGGEQGLLISISPGSATSLYRVEFSGDKPLRKYLREHAAKFDRFRQEELSLTVNRLFRTLKKIYAKEGTSQELSQFRDSVGLAASVQGLGYFVDAVHQRQVFPCVYEDDDALYFLLPAGVKRFQLTGKTRKGSDVFFPGQFEVRVQGSIRLDDSTPDEPKPNAEQTGDSKDDDSEIPANR